MLFKSVFTVSSLAVLATANPGWGTSKPAWGTTTTTSKWGPTPTTKSGWGTTSHPATPTGGSGGFNKQCLNFGISLLDCTELGNIAGLNGNTIGVGGSAVPGPSKPVNNGAQFLDACKNFGISVGDCAKLLNISLLNGNSIDIDLADLTSLVSALGLPSGILGGLVPSVIGGLVPLVTGMV